jgi:hypothetical protein
MKAGRSRYGEGDVLAVPAIRKDGSQISVEFTIVLLRDGTGALLGIGELKRADSRVATLISGCKCGFSPPYLDGARPRLVFK